MNVPQDVFNSLSLHTELMQDFLRHSLTKQISLPRCYQQQRFPVYTASPVRVNIVQSDSQTHKSGLLF